MSLPVTIKVVTSSSYYIILYLRSMSLVNKGMIHYTFIHMFQVVLFSVPNKTLSVLGTHDQNGSKICQKM